MGFKKGHIVSEETRKKISLANKGKPSSRGMLGKHHSEESKIKMKLAHKDQRTNLGKHWKIKDTSNMHHKSWMKGRTHTEESRLKIKEARKKQVITVESRLKRSKAEKGKNHWNWQGGKSSENHRLRNSIEYAIWREAVFARDNYTCVWCNQRGGRLNADHIKPFATYPELRLAINNGRTLCLKCHKATDNYLVNIKKSGLNLFSTYE